MILGVNVMRLRPCVWDHVVITLRTAALTRFKCWSSDWFSVWSGACFVALLLRNQNTKYIGFLHRARHRAGAGEPKAVFLPGAREGRQC